MKTGAELWKIVAVIGLLQSFLDEWEIHVYIHIAKVCEKNTSVELCVLSEYMTVVAKTELFYRMFHVNYLQTHLRAL